jgi:hypothetical protein
LETQSEHLLAYRALLSVSKEDSFATKRKMKEKNQQEQKAEQLNNKKINQPDTNARKQTNQ